MNLSEKIVFLDDFTFKTLTITHFTEWELSSYEENSAFCQNGQFGPVRAKSFSACINKAFASIEEAINV